MGAASQSSAAPLFSYAMLSSLYKRCSFDSTSVRGAACGLLVVIAGLLPITGLAGSGDNTEIDFSRPIENMGHDPDAAQPANPRNLLTRERGYDAAWLKS